MEKLICEWSENMTEEEQKYKNSGFIKTKTSVFIEPPTNEQLKESFNKMENNISFGIRGLQKHYDRNGFLNKIIGNDCDKNKFGNNFINEFFNTEIIWKNIYLLNKNIILEMRNEEYGARWYINDNEPVFRGIIEPYTTYLEYKNKKIEKKINN